MSTILITGATSGLGEGLAYRLQGTGKLLLTGRNVDKLKSLKESFRGQVEILPCDLSKSTKEVLDWIRTEKPDLIFNNAGFGLYGPFDEMTLDEMHDMVHVNCMALSQFTQQAIQIWKKDKKGGVVMNISSFAGFVPMPLSALYGATKAFVTRLSESLDLEYKREGIHILAACPGMVETDFSRRASRGKNGVVRSFSEKLILMRCEHIVDKILQQVKNKRTIQVLDARYQWLNLLYKCIPRRVSSGIIAYNLKNRL